LDESISVDVGEPKWWTIKWCWWITDVEERSLYGQVLLEENGHL